MTFNTVNKKILFPVLSLAFILFLGPGLFMSRSNINSMQRMMDSKADGIATIISSFAADYFAFFDFSDFESIVRALEKDPDISYATFYNSDMEPLTKIKGTKEETSSMMMVNREIKDSNGNLLDICRSPLEWKTWKKVNAAILSW